MYQPYYNSGQYMPGFQNSYQIQPNQLIRVNGMDGAKAYQMSPNSTVALFDANEDIMYIKSSDGAGFPTIRTFSFKEILPEASSAAPNYISREEFENFKAEVLNYAQQLVSKQRNQGEQPRRSQESSKGNGKG